MWRVYPFKDGEVCCQKTYLSFVDSVWEIFGPLLKGVPAVIIPEEVVKDPPLLVDNLAAAHVSRISLVPSLLGVLLDSFGDLQKRLFDLKIWVSSGEEISVELAQRFRQVMPEAKLINLYGSSEVSADVSCYEVADGRLHRCIPIGRPIDNTSIYILDSHLQPVPIGVPGELYIGGVGLARGYLNEPDLTAERFIPSPFEQEQVLFKTGDLGRYLPDGNIEFIGRVDHQVKIRGFRIEVGEVEAVLNKHSDVKESIVLAREDRSDEKSLVAYFGSSRNQTPTISELRRYLRQKLPDYMVPSTFVLLDSLPLLPNGKVDHRALPAPEKVRQEPTESSVKPRDELELHLTKIWEKVLGVKNIGMKDNFFDLGGHSLLAVRLFARIQKIFGKDLPLTILFQAPTVEQLSSILRQEGWSSPWSSLVPIHHEGSKPPFFCVHGCTGRVIHFYDLARRLSQDYPFYGLTAQGRENGQDPHKQIEEMAAHYIKEIRTIQFYGPYFIGGEGAGCAIALEMAHQLESQGQKVALIVLISPANAHLNLSHLNLSMGSSSLRKFFRLLVILLKNLLFIILNNRPLIPALYNAFSNRVLWHFPIFHRFIPIEVHRRRRFIKTFNEARLSYTPEAYNGRITCILRDEFAGNPQKGLGDWQSLSVGGLNVRFVPGNLLSMWHEPHVSILAKKLKTCLDEAQMDNQGL
jgi:thioesterase domain-containing protein/acyl carrier protein